MKARRSADSVGAALAEGMPNRPPRSITCNAKAKDVRAQDIE